jgi:hypothetical protein
MVSHRWASVVPIGFNVNSLEARPPSGGLRRLWVAMGLPG